ncbi:hypothetical protein ACH5RR_010459 [Cinchona calisaya]|uniref:Uncharacterized protein n=1 Tax=Cinchona calisaya TaxID=153742 RepID=A0ABD3AJ03_9GENT
MRMIPQLLEAMALRILELGRLALAVEEMEGVLYKVARVVKVRVEVVVVLYKAVGKMEGVLYKVAMMVVEVNELVGRECSIGGKIVMSKHMLGG